MIQASIVNKLRVGVLMGGRSIEREVSFNSGRTICDHLDTSRYEIIPIFQTHNGQIYLLPWYFLHRGKISDFYARLDSEAKKIIWDDLKNLVDFVYIALHGRLGEDGRIQGFLDVLGIPYLGSKVFGGALGMNKIIQKQILKSDGIKVPGHVIVYYFEAKKITADEIFKRLEKEKINFPCIVKPAHEGSSFGISVVEKKEEILSAIKKAATCDQSVIQDVLIEEKIVGMEFVCVCLKDKNSKSEDDWFALPVTEVIPEKDTKFFDYVQKYMPGRATKITPARCSTEEIEKIQKACLQVTKFLNFSTISRTDGFLTKDGQVVIIDPNTLTGMAPSSFLFHQAAEAGMSHTDLINYLIESELNQHRLFDVVLKKIDDQIERERMNKTKMRVVVLLGGNTNEREVSLDSGRNVCYKLSPKKYEVIPVFVNDNLELFKISQRLLVQNSTREISLHVTKQMQIKWNDLPQICDFVFIGLHGGAGENGQIQGTLEMLGLPYNGPGVLASAMCMDKFKTNEFLRSLGFDVPFSKLLKKEIWLKEKTNKDFIRKLLIEFTFPLILKPHDDGCSVFVQKIKNEKEFISALDSYFEISGKDAVMIEEAIKAIELTCAVIGNEKALALPPSKVFAQGDILSIEEKFLPGAGENLTPAPIGEKAIKLVQDVMEKAYMAIGCKGYTRIDCFYQSAKGSPTKKDRVIILEFNTLPGLTPATCIFHQAAEIGLKPMEFIDKIVEFGLQLHAKKEVAKVVKEEKLEI